ncbi:MAG: DUF3631 domain-containing protein, partial [Gammaproteobacteria bacterium]
NWKGETLPFFAGDGRKLTEAERQDRERRRADAIRQAREEKARRRAEARDRAQALWKAAKPVPADNPYLTLKAAAPVAALREIPAVEAAEVLGYTPKSSDEPLTGRLLIVPVKVGGELSTVEMIDGGGRKTALYGGAKRGSYWAAQPLPEGDSERLVLLIGEGVATVLSAKEASGHSAIAALSCGNLEPVAKAMRDLYPKAALVILADLVKATGEPDPHAIEAARAVGALVAAPDFGEGRPEGATDFNDLALHRDLEAVRVCIEAAVRPAEGPSGDEANESVSSSPDTEEATKVVISRLAALSPIEYDRAREKEATRLGVRVATLDAEVAKARKTATGENDNLQGQAVLFDEPEPWPEPVDGEAVLNEIAKTFLRYLVLPDHAEVALALWAMHAQSFKAFIHTPRLSIRSPEKGCGKTTCIDVLALLTPKAQRIENLTTAGLFRLIDKYAPTLLVDECDKHLSRNEELCGALNSGHKRGGVIPRCEGEKNEVRMFRVFAPVALAGIRELPGTLHDRSIVINLKRAIPGEVHQGFDSRRTAHETELCRKLARWCADHRAELEAADPVMPENFYNRLADNWRPLLTLADAVGGSWPEKARRAAVALSSGTDNDNESLRVQLLVDIWRVFDTTKAERIASEDMVEALNGMEDRPWPEINSGKTLTKTRMARLLKPFGIKPKQVRLPSGRTGISGYEREWFADAFNRYLPPEHYPHENSTPLQDKQGAGFSHFQNSTGDPVVELSNSLKPSQDGGCRGVDLSHGGTAGGWDGNETFNFEEAEAF